MPGREPAHPARGWGAALRRHWPTPGAQLGINEHTYLDALPQQALNAYEDQCAPANPRMPMLNDMQELMRTA